MSVLVVISIDCAPKFKKTMHDTLSSEHIKHLNEIESINEINSVINNPDFKNIEKFKNIPTKKYNESSIAIEDTKSESNAITSSTTAKSIRTTLKVDDSSENDISSDWLDPEIKENEIIKFNQTLKANNNITQENNTTTVTEHALIESVEEDDYAANIDKTSKREISLQTIFKKILRSDSDMYAHGEPDKGTLTDGYEFDINRCRYVGKRFLCGYNKNIGEITDSDETEDLGNGCKIRGDRIECGYNAGEKKLEKSPLSAMIPDAETQPINESTISYTATGQPVNPTDLTKLPQRIAEPGKACFEKDDHVVCYDIPV